MITHRHWMRTFTGGQFDFVDPQPEMVKVRDIAHHTSLLCRFTGALQEFFSVAEHCLIVSHLVPPEFAFEGLMHDASEAYLNDLNKPAKETLLDYKALEKKIEHIIALKYGLPTTMSPEVKYADNTSLRAEAAEILLETDFSEWGDMEYDPTYVYGRIPLTSRQAERKFLIRFDELAKGKFDALTD